MEDQVQDLKGLHRALLVNQLATDIDTISFPCFYALCYVLHGRWTEVKISQASGFLDSGTVEMELMPGTDYNTQTNTVDQ